MITKNISLKVKNEMIVGAIISKSNNSELPGLVFLHGAGTGVKERIYSISDPIINSGVNILAFDFSGHGESTGELKKGSLHKRVIEAREMINHFASKEPLIICGSSMGGYIALKLLEFYPIDTLILFCPALYDKDAFNLLFDEGFTDIIRKPKSWENTDVLKLLGSFTGNLLVILGEKDEVIPKEVIELIMSHASNAQKKELYIIPDCPHRINEWLADNESAAKDVHRKIKEFIF